MLTRLTDYYRQRFWQAGAAGPPGLGREFVQILILACRGLIKNRAWLQAASLAYGTILALIPLLALLFAILKSLGIQRLLAALLMERLAPGAHDFAVQILDYIENIRVTSLGVFGVAWLIAALIILMTTIEQAFNDTWRVAHTRPLRRKLSDYLSIFLLFPILMALAISLSSGLLSHPDVRRLLFGLLPDFFYSATSNLLSLGLLWAAFTFIYLVMPNTRVHFIPALVGGVLGGSLWQVAHIVFSWFQGLGTYYNAVYGALYHLLFLVIWMFWSWLVVLFGNEVAYAQQNLPRLRQSFFRPLPNREPVDEYLALTALAAIGARYVTRRPPLTRDDFALMFSQDNFLAERLVQVLKECRLILETAPAKPGNPPGLIPAMPLDQMTVGEALACFRAARGAALADSLSQEPRFEALLQRLAAPAAPSPWDSLSLAEFVALASEAPPADGRRI